MSVDRLRIVLRTLELLAALTAGMLIGRNLLAPSQQTQNSPNMTAIAKSDSDCYKNFIHGLAKEIPSGEGRDSASIEVRKVEPRTKKIDEALQRAGSSPSGSPGC